MVVSHPYRSPYLKHTTDYVQTTINSHTGVRVNAKVRPLLTNDKSTYGFHQILNTGIHGNMGLHCTCLLDFNKLTSSTISQILCK